ncbi:MAG: malate dehydrogenase [Candidatus Bathyarchaeota archaeon]|jgi:malate dehydrogenase|nr:malate dehydrogenase [Candidatus Bathyarchaeota archaeon A05DMB-5]MDH7558274.1 malate dehydrogenase [Candidatus Bathyarchaeota archaeon]
MITIIGAGKVGSAAAFNILRYRIGDVVLIDIFENLAKGEALDMMQTAPAIEFDGKIVGTNDFSAMKNSEIVILTAGEARKPGMTRIDLMNRNATIVKSVVKEIVKYTPDCKLMVVTNPVDIMTYVAYKESGFERNRVFGMGNILDTLRFRSYIATELNVSREDVRALVIGEHGDSMVPLVEYASVSGIPITKLLREEQIEKIVNLTVSSGADVIKLKGSTTYAPAATIAIMADAILRGRNRVMSVSTVLQGEYGFSDVSIGVPVVLGRNGIERILELKLMPKTKKSFENSVLTIKEAIKKLNG